MTATKYSADELDLIRMYYPDIDLLIAHLPNRTKSGIQSTAKRVGVSPPRDLWTVSEDQALRRTYPDRPKTEKALPRRTWRAIMNRAQFLGLANHRRTWSTERKQVLAQLAGNVTDREAAKMMGGSTVAIATKRRRLHLRGCSPSLPKPVVVPIVNDIRVAAKARNVVLTKLTNALGYPKLKPSLTERTISVKTVVKVVQVLGGELYVEWPD
jgi:hypothetical protein